MKSVLVTGCFNVLHPGHLRLLRFAKENGDRLIVAVQSSRLAGSSAHVHEHLRLEGIKSISWVDEAFIFDGPVEALIRKVKPNVVVKGREHELEINPELAVLREYGGNLVFSSGETVFSSLDLIRKESQGIEIRAISPPLEYMKRHRIELPRLIDLVHRFPSIKVCVMGDLIIDEYITCEPLGMSHEDPSIVVTPIDTDLFLGGAGIVASHAAGLGANVSFMSVTGDDELREYALDTLRTSNVESFLVVDTSRPTTLKQRYRSKGKSLLRVSHLHQGAISSDLQNMVLKRLEECLEDINLLVFSDFNYGFLPQQLIDQVTVMAKKRNIMMVADSQSSSQVGDISRFRGMDLITPTEREARISTRNRECGLVVLAECLRQQSVSANVLLKLGEEGLLIHAANHAECDWLTDRIGALNNMPKDVAGAGDSLLITSSMVMAVGGNIWEAACLGSMAAAVQVGRVGNIPMTVRDLMQELR